MKFLIVVALFAVARAELFETLMRSEIQAAVDAIHNVEHSHITLRDLEEQERMLLVREVQTDIGQTLSEKLDNVTNKLVEAIAQGKQGIMTLFNQYRQLVNDLKELGGKAANHINGSVVTLKDKLAVLVNNHLSPAVKLVINFINAFFGKNGLVAFDKLEDEVTAEVVVRALQRRGVIGDFFGGIFDTAKDILNKMLTGLHGKFKELGQFLLDLTKAHLEAAKPHVDNLKQLAQEFIDHAKEATAQTLQEAVEFFGMYKSDLGGLYQQLVDAVNKVKGHIQATRPPTGPTF